MTGADAAGATFDGTYKEDGERVSFTLTMTVPPGVVLVQGTPARPVSYEVPIAASVPIRALNSLEPVRLEMPQGPVNVIFRRLQNLDKSVPVIRSRCNTCLRDTDHDVLHTSSTADDVPDGSRVEVRHLIVSCRGCGDRSLRDETYLYYTLPDEEPPTPTIRYTPPRLWRGPPDWLPTIEESDPDLHGMLVEVYLAANDEQPRLL